jgi:sporulation protein YlmC with PRC-barrel domain
MSKRFLVTATSIAALFAAAQTVPSFAQDASSDANVTIVNPDGSTQEAAEGAGEAIEDAAEATGEAVEDTTEAAGQAVEDAAETMTETVETPAEETEEAAADPADVPPPEEGTPVEGQIFQQSPESFLASTLLDADVVSVEGETIGDVVDLVLDSEGSIEGVVVGVGGFLGIGKKWVALQFDTIDTRQEESLNLTFVLNATREELEDAPAFKTQQEVQREAEAAAAAQQAPAGGIVPPPLPGEPPASPSN